MLPLLLGALVGVVVWIVATVFFGYPALIIGALIAVALMYAFILALTGAGLFGSKTGGSSGH